MGYNIKRREKDIQLSILHYLKNIGAYAGKTKTVGIYNPKTKVRYKDFWTFRGFADITCFWNKKIYFIEVKRADGVMSPHQRTFQLLCKDAEIPYIIAKELSDVTNVIS